MTPYVWPRDGRLLWFTCRWPTGRELAVSLPEGASERETRLLGLALRSLEDSGLDLRFRSDATADRADIVLAVSQVDPAKSGRTAADCAVSGQGGGIAATLVHAQVMLQRSNENALGKAVPLSEAEWLGTAIHELGHALGFQGHVVGPGPMVRELERVRAIGRRVLDGGPLEAPSLLALYALPSGTLLRRDALPGGRTDRIDRLGALARERGYRGPFVRVGDATALIDWRHPDGRLVGVFLPELPRALADPVRLRIVPDPVALAWLGPEDTR